MAGSAVFNGTNASGLYRPGGNILTTLPITLCCWFKFSTTYTANIAGPLTDGSNPACMFRLNAGASCANRNAGGGFASGAAADVGGSTFQSWVGVFTASNTKIYLNGVLGATDATAIPADNLTAIIMGAQLSAGAPAFWAALSASHYSIHLANFTLSDAQHHAAGWSADRLPSPWAWYKLETNGNDSIGTRHLTMANVTFSGTGPNIDYGNDWTAAMRNPDRTPDSTPQDRQRLLRRR